MYQQIIPKNKQKLQRKVHERYQNISEEETEEKRQYGYEKYTNLSESQQRNLMGYSKTFLQNVQKLLMKIFNIYKLIDFLILIKVKIRRQVLSNVKRIKIGFQICILQNAFFAIKEIY